MSNYVVELTPKQLIILYALVGENSYVNTMKMVTHSVITAKVNDVDEDFIAAHIPNISSDDVTNTFKLLAKTMPCAKKEQFKVLFKVQGQEWQLSENYYINTQTFFDKHPGVTFESVSLVSETKKLL